MKNPEKPIRLAIVDDHPMVLRGLSDILRNHTHIRVDALYKNAVELLAGLETQQPDVLLLDIQLPDISGDELAPELLEKYPELKILVLTNFDSVMYASKMQWQGVHGYLLKTADETTLIEAIETVYGGGHFMEKEMQDNIEQHPLKSKKILAAKTALTSREKETLQLISDGFTDQKIAETLFLSPKTVKQYRMALLLKLDVNNTASLVRKALEMGLVR